MTGSAVASPIVRARFAVWMVVRVSVVRVLWGSRVVRWGSVGVSCSVMGRSVGRTVAAILVVRVFLGRVVWVKVSA